MKTLSDFNFKDKLVLLRADINSDVINQKVLMSERIKAASETINYLARKKARVIVISHQGNPGKDDFISLKQHSKFLNKFVKIRYIPDIVGEKAIKAIKTLKPGEAILLENLRFLEEEQDISKKPNRILKLAKLADIYVNDAFSVCHRKHSSIVLLPKIIKKTCAGLLLEREVSSLRKISIKDCLYILGGAKPEENLKLLKTETKIIVGGIFGQMCIEAKGKKLGDNNDRINREMSKDYDEVVQELKEKLGELDILLPVDYAIEVSGKRAELPLEKFPTKYIIYDIGEKTQKLFIEEIKRAKAVYMKGPLGFASKKKFSQGTFSILRAIAKQTSEGRLFSLIGGGHLSDAIKASKIPKSKFSHISLSGGALLNYVAGEKLPGLQALA